MDINSPLSQLSGVGEKIAKNLKVLGLETARDLLFHLPFRYDDFTKTVKIKDLKPGDNASIVGQIELLQNKRAWKRRIYITEALIRDETEAVKVVWFNQPFIAKNLQVGDTVSLAGKTEEDHGILTMLSPIYEKVGSGRLIHTQGLVPIYHLSEGLTRKQLRFFVKQVLPLSDQLPDIVPEKTQKKIGLLPLGEAIKKIHFPDSHKEAEAAHKRLAFGELFLLQIKSLFLKKEKAKARAPKIAFKGKETREFVDSLPFKLTDDQKKSAWQILKEMEEPRPMARLLNGDVGSGKTLVAVIALLNTALNGAQGVLMAPTEILAHQHFNSLSRLLAAFPLKIALLTNNYRLLNGSEEKVPRAEMLKIIAAGEADIIIGTHALVQEDVRFKKLSLAVVDEQHRFGVEQRKALVAKSGQKGFEPHLLSMTATPIPRSLALALFGDLEVSVIKQMPLGRKPIVTKIVPENKRQAAYEFLRKEVSKGRQVFVVCPLIEESDFFGSKAVKSEFEKLDKEVFPEIPTAMLHGKLKASAKEEIMKDFLDGKYKILISTSVIEVGVDVPNATIMMIEGAERFGLAQLHQFRGRVGRGGEQSYCFLFTGDDSPAQNQRLQAMEKYADGFSLAQMDLKLRGSGEVYGTLQSGFPELRIATLFDYELMKSAQEEAAALFTEDAELKNHPLLKKEAEIFEEKIHLE